jgi:hypothetical protein
MTKGVEVTARRSYGKVQSDSYLLTFDPNEDKEVNARKMAQRLASKRKLKSALITLLAAMHDVELEMGHEIDLSEFTSRFVKGLVLGTPAYGSVHITAEVSPDQLQSEWVGTVDHVDPEEARDNLQLRMGNMLDEDDEF